MRLLFVLLMLFFLLSSCSYSLWIKRTDWYIVKDINCNDNCSFVQPESDKTLPCQKDMRIMKVYPTGIIYMYCTEPRVTDLSKCWKNAMKKLSWWEQFKINHIKE